MKSTELQKWSTVLVTRTFLFIWMSLLIGVTKGSQDDCPWHKNEDETPDDIKSRCICATNPSANNQLSVQCQEIDAQKLVSVLLNYYSGTDKPLELLYLNGSLVTDEKGNIPARLFSELKLVSLQLSSCGIKSIHKDAFLGLENHMKHLSMTQNSLTEVPTESTKNLQRLTLLDLSYNKISKIPQRAFENLTKLSTLKLNDNNLEFDADSFMGLEGSLRNLNLKGTRVSMIPESISNLSSLAFLDLAQNRLRELEPSQFLRLHSLTALNLERNLLQKLPKTVFDGVNDTLSSLSLLNNLITHFPREALYTLKELRVLDLGFNLLTEIPKNAYDGLTSLTLLALDGNPLATLSQSSFSSLNSTLRGISLGGRFLNCDCRLQWILEWIREYDLQVTSRERNPQFCGSPAALKASSFYQITPEDLQCVEGNETVSKSDYDVDLKPEDIALLGIGATNSVSSAHRYPSEEDTASEQETDENRQTYALEDSVPKPRNFTRPRYRFRRPRPKLNPEPHAEQEVIQPESVKKSTSYEDKESVENNAEEIVNLDFADDSVSNDKSSSFMPSTFLPTTVSRFATAPTTTTTTTKKAPPTTTTKAPPTTTTKAPPITTNTLRTTTKRGPIAIRPYNMRQKVTPRVVMSTSSTTSTVSGTGNSSTKTIYRNNMTFAPSSTFPTTTTAKSINDQTADKKHSSKMIEAMDLDDSKIPVISGIGLSISEASISTSGSKVIKHPSPIQANSAVIVKPQDAINSPPSLHHQGTQPPRFLPPNLIFAEKSDIKIREVERVGDSILLQWDSPNHSTGFRIIYRLFGEDTFRHGPPLASTEREYRIRNIPNSECIVVCVVPYEDILYNEINPSAASIPPGSYCRELKPSSQSALINNMDKITIGASAAICITVLLAVLIFIGVTKRSKTRRPQSALMAKAPPTMTPSPGPAMITPGPFSSMVKEWDQMSVVSTKSIPRARVYHGSIDGLATIGTPRASMMAHNHNHHHRPHQEGHATHRSYLSNHHHHHNHSMHNFAHGNGHVHTASNTAAAVNNYLNNQSRLLRTSLGSRASYDALNKMSTVQSHRPYDQNKRRRPARISQSESLNTLNGYETPDNWTDHDMDFYVARNPTRHDLVQL